jgi:hypothetical protein
MNFFEGKLFKKVHQYQLEAFYSYKMLPILCT